MNMKAYLANELRTRAVMNAWHIDFQKKFGQNFLIEERIPRGIVEAAGVTKEDCVLEIGPGIGTMTVTEAICAPEARSFIRMGVVM